MVINLPTEKSQPVKDLSKTVIFITGEAKIGKSTFVSQIPNVLMIPTEPGLSAISSYKYPILTSWEDFIELLNQLFFVYERDKELVYSSIAIDTIDNLTDFCIDYICKREGVQKSKDLAFGETYQLVRKEMNEKFTAILAHLPVGLIFVGHNKVRNIKTKTGNTVKIVPCLPPSIAIYIQSFANLNLVFDHFQYKDEQGKMQETRVIRTSSTKNFSAGCHYQLPEIIPLNYESFLEAFNNSESFDSKIPEEYQEVTEEINEEEK